jgi:hypothetical protein
MVYPALLQLMSTPRLPVVNWTDAPADLNGLVRFAKRRNLVSARAITFQTQSTKSFTNNFVISPHSYIITITTVEAQALRRKRITAEGGSISCHALWYLWSDRYFAEYDYFGIPVTIIPPTLQTPYSISHRRNIILAIYNTVRKLINLYN